ncbi:uncharacterized protein LOC108818637 [Raphanus sativus]|uniref:Uncharacterized protein LOC108818637 n=1 Tax=Raphanus sativus TaxID=3726 RepID=A0A6J0KJ46_RAPSA|nr:uncharacterized protein LOC108818637 [Raphanus sativus]XP_018447054.1 uncharacterized protein LOC108818637 [Raphanus sativus]
MSSLISSCSLFLLGIDLEAEKTRKKTELELSSDGEKSRNKTKVDLNQSAAAAITDVDERYELRGNVQLEVVATESSPRDDTLPETARKETEMGEKSVGRVNVETDNLDSSSGLATKSDTEKRSEDDINRGNW